MQGTKITKQRIGNHFAYGWWKYLLLVIVAVVGWNLIYTTTAYRAPKEKRLDVTFVTHSIADDVLNGIRAEILAKYPQVEDATVTGIVYTEEDNYYGSMQLSTYIGAGEGNVYFFPRERFDVYAASDIFVPLEEYIHSGALNVEGMDISRGIAANGEGEKAQYGIPLDALYGMMELGIDNRGMVVGIMLYSENVDAAVAWINDWIQEYTAPKPQWLVEEEERLNVDSVGASHMPSY